MLRSIGYASDLLPQGFTAAVSPPRELISSRTFSADARPSLSPAPSPSIQTISYSRNWLSFSLTQTFSGAPLLRTLPPSQHYTCAVIANAKEQLSRMRNDPYYASSPGTGNDEANALTLARNADWPEESE